MEIGKKISFYLRKLRLHRFRTTVYGNVSTLMVESKHTFRVADKPTTGFKQIDTKPFKNRRAYYIVVDNRLAHVSWVFKRNLLARQLKFKNSYVIGDCITYEEFRGIGLYGEMVAYIINLNKDINHILFIEPENHASIRGVEKIGLKCIGVFEVFRFLGIALRVKRL